MNLSLFDSPEFSDPEPEKENQAAIEEVFSDWKTVMEYPTRRLTPARRRFISGRLRHYSVEQLKQVIRIVAKDAWWRGKNNRNQPYDDIVNIFRNDDRVDMFLSKGQTRDLSASDKPIETEEF